VVSARLRRRRRTAVAAVGGGADQRATGGAASKRYVAPGQNRRVYVSQLSAVCSSVCLFWFATVAPRRLLFCSQGRPLTHCTFSSSRRVCEAWRTTTETAARGAPPGCNAGRARRCRRLRSPRAPQRRSPPAPRSGYEDEPMEEPLEEPEARLARHSLLPRVDVCRYSGGRGGGSGGRRRGRGHAAHHHRGAAERRGSSQPRCGTHCRISAAAAHWASFSARAHVLQFSLVHRSSLTRRLADASKPKMTTPYMTKYERARVLGTRALQISMNAPVMVELDGETDPLEARAAPRRRSTRAHSSRRLPARSCERARCPSPSAASCPTARTRTGVRWTPARVAARERTTHAGAGVHELIREDVDKRRVG